MLNAPVVIITLIIAVLIGGITVISLQASNKSKIIKLLLAFSGGFMLSIAFTHFIPELYAENTFYIGYFILLGFLIQLILEFFSGGIEHGHVHISKNQKIPWALLISLSLHSIIEGIPLGNMIEGISLSDHHNHDAKSLFLGILFHQIPVAIALMTLLTQSKIANWKSWLLLSLFGIMTPLGVGVGLIIPAKNLGIDEHVILAIVVGIFLHISTTIIFETSENHKFNLLKLVSILVGCSFAFGLNWI
jgi:zinc transporter ZupT